MTRAWNTPIFMVAFVYFVADAVFSYVTRPITVWMARQRLLQRARLWVASLPPYPSLVLFVVPIIILEPTKPLSGYLIGTGHFFAGAVIFIVAEVLKLTLVERLFQLNKKKLLSIPSFAWGYRYWRAMMNKVESLAVWKTARRVAVQAGKALRSTFRRARSDRAWRIDRTASPSPSCWWK